MRDVREEKLVGNRELLFFNAKDFVTRTKR